MATPSEEIQGTYRCPVCGHRDVAELDAPDAVRIIACSYCATSLEVAARGLDSVRFSVQVAEQPTPY
jgi:transcription elongation factor Elf1